MPDAASTPRSKAPSRAEIRPQPPVGPRLPSRGWSAAVSSATVLGLLALWWLATSRGWVKPLFLPRPAAVWAAFALLPLGLLLAVSIAGLPAVGLILVVALLVVPAAAARLLVTRLPAMLALAGLFGATAGVAGALASTRLAAIPTGAAVVLAGLVIFGMALAVSRRRA